MTLVKWNHRPATAFPKWVDDFFGRDMHELFNNPEFAQVPAVNISENDGSFNVQVAAPGLKKEDFKISLNDNKLTISAENEAKVEESTEKFYRREFSFKQFTRTFTLPDTIDTGSITANYEDGVLKLALPKLEQQKVEKARMIEIK